MKNTIKQIIDSVLAGIMIAIGAIVYIKTLNSIAGALFFSIGLIGVFSFQLNLYTGKIGYIKHIKETPFLLAILLFNLIGCCILFLVAPIQNNPIIQLKLQVPWYEVIFKGMMCGILIYLAAEQFKEGRLWVTLLAVPAFILAGFEHCIADFCFMILTRTFTLQAFNFLILVILGNTLGSIVFSILTNKKGVKIK